MLKAARARLSAGRDGAAEGAAGESGFTLIELMVVVLIIAILMAIAIPTFLGAKGNAQDRSAQENVRNALTNADTIYANTNNYSSLTLPLLESADPSLFPTASALASTQPATQTTIGWNISAPGASPSVVSFASQSATLKCWMIWQSSNAATGFGEDTVDGANCPTTDLTVPAAVPSSSGTVHWQTSGGFPNF